MNELVITLVVVLAVISVFAIVFGIYLIKQDKKINRKK